MRSGYKGELCHDCVKAVKAKKVIPTTLICSWPLSISDDIGQRFESFYLVFLRLLPWVCGDKNNHYNSVNHQKCCCKWHRNISYKFQYFQVCYFCLILKTLLCDNFECILQMRRLRLSEWLTFTSKNRLLQAVLDAVSKKGKWKMFRRMHFK